MIDIVLTIITFLLTVFCHIILHRWLQKYGYKTFKTIVIFFIGFFINAWILLSPFYVFTFSFSAIVLYGLLSLVYILLFTSPYLEDLSPSFSIILLLNRYHMLRSNEIMNNFSDKIVIVKRLEALVHSGKIRKNNSRYIITTSGRRIIGFIDLYRRILGWEFGG